MKKILVVDDETMIREMIKTRLEANNYEVITAGDGQEALDKAHRENPDLILLDLMLPKVNGYKVCRMLKFDDKYKKIPIIMLTERTTEDKVKAGEEVGADMSLTKTFDSKIPLGKIEELLNK